MEVQEELQLFTRYFNRFNAGDNALVAISSVHLAQQLEPYISRSLDLGWVIRCIMDINSSNLFSGARSDEFVNTDNSKHPEYQYAKFIIRLCNLFLTVGEEKTLTLDEANMYELDDSATLYFGKNLTGLNKELISLACPELAMSCEEEQI